MQNSNSNPNFLPTKISAVILAGGRASRMGGQDKGLLTLCQQPMIAHVIRLLQPQVTQLLINANRNIDAYSALGYRVIRDDVGEFFGPLAGMLAALETCTYDYLLTVPCDSPLVPDDYAQRMLAALLAKQAQLAVAYDGERLQPVFALLMTELKTDLRYFLTSGGRKIDRWFASHTMTTVDFSDHQAMFRNINTRDDLHNLESELSR